MVENNAVPFKAIEDTKSTPDKAQVNFNFKAKATTKEKLWTTDFYIQKLKHELATFEVNGKRPYYEQAQHLIYRIPVYKPTPKYEISLSHISQRMKEELESLDEITLRLVLRQAVGRIFEDINSEYYHDSVSKLLEVELTK